MPYLVDLAMRLLVKKFSNSKLSVLPIECLSILKVENQGRGKAREEMRERHSITSKTVKVM